MPGLYNVADQVGLEMTFRNALGVPTDPTTVTFKLTPPSGAVTTYVYGVDAQLVHTTPGSGLYTVDVIFTDPGVYGYLFTGTGTVNQSEEDQLFVREPLVAFPRDRGYTNARLIGRYLNRTLDGAQSIQAETVIAAVEQYIDRKLGRSWGAASPTTELHQVARDGIIRLNNYPITALTSITAGGYPMSPISLGTLLSATEYGVIDAARGLVYAPGYAGYAASVVYTHAGPPCPADVSLAATIIAANWLQPAIGGVDGTIKSVSYAGELSYTYADSGGERAIPPEAYKLLDMVPRRRFA